MNEQISVKPDTIALEDLLYDIANGEYKIPIFQRDFVWKTSQIIELFDSILKGYPIGNLLFLNINDYKAKDKIGPYTIKKENNNVKYILDGSQRISTLFGVLTNPKEYKGEVNKNELNNFLIYFDVRENNFTYIRNKRDKNVYSIPLYEIYNNRELFNFIRELDKEDITLIKKNEYIDRARNLHNILHKYRLFYVEINGGDIKSAVEIFSRINSRGTEIHKDSMLSALSYNVETEFLLSDSITEFINGLDIYNFEDLKRDTILDCISNATGKIYFDVKVEDLVKNPDLESFTNKAYIHIKKAVDFLYKKIFILNNTLLPYPSQLIFISEYFRLNPEPTFQQYNALETWFWITTYSNYFTLYSLSQQKSAYEVFCEFAKGQHPDGIYKVNSDMTFNTAKYPNKLNFTGVRPKALQLFYLKSIIQNNPIQDREGIKEIFISTSKTDRTPANIILRLSSEFEEDKNKKQVNNFIKTSSIEVLERHFITQEMLDLYKDSKIDVFISKREEYLKSKESEFVTNIGVRYIE